MAFGLSSYSLVLPVRCYVMPYHALSCHYKLCYSIQGIVSRLELARYKARHLGFPIRFLGMSMTRLENAVLSFRFPS